MASMIDEHPAFFDTGGLPLVNGEVFIGIVDLDPEANPTAIFSDPELSVELANPQTIDAFGRATNKIYIPGRYSMEVKNSNDVQQYINLDNGEEAAGGISQIINVLGTNAITGEVSPTPITAYVDNEIYMFQAFASNTGAVTVNWDSVGAKALVYDFNLALEENHIIADQTMAAAFNAAEDNFQWLNPNRTVIYGNEGASIASASTVELGDATGNSLDISGSTTITSFGTTPDGTEYWCNILGAPQITHNGTSLIIPGNVNYQAAAGDLIRVQSLGGGNNAIQIFPETGQPIIPTTAATQAEQETGTTLLAPVTPGRQQFHQSACKGWADWNSDATPTVGASYNVTGVAKNATGDYTVTWDVDMSGASYCALSTGFEVTTIAMVRNKAVGTIDVRTLDGGNTSIDRNANFIAAFGDQ